MQPPTNRKSLLVVKTTPSMMAKMTSLGFVWDIESSL